MYEPSALAELLREAVADAHRRGDVGLWLESRLADIAEYLDLDAEFPSVAGDWIPAQLARFRRSNRGAS